MSYRTNLVSLKQEVLERLHELVTPAKTVLFTEEQTEDEEAPVNLYLNFAGDGDVFPILSVWEESDSEVEGGVLMVELWDVYDQNTVSYKLETVASIEELINLSEYLEELNKQ